VTLITAESDTAIVVEINLPENMRRIARGIRREGDVVAHSTHGTIQPEYFIYFSNA
jgi:hypothetical protein